MPDLQFFFWPAFLLKRDTGLCRVALMYARSASRAKQRFEPEQASTDRNIALEQGLRVIPGALAQSRRIENEATNLVLGIRHYPGWHRL